MADYINKGEITNANNIKNVVVYALVKEGFLSEASAVEFNKNYSVILTEKSWFKNWYNYLFKKRNDGQYYDVVKIVNFESVQLNYGESDLDSENEQSVSELKFQLTQALKSENFELAKKLQEKIDKLEGK